MDPKLLLLFLFVVTVELLLTHGFFEGHVVNGDRYLEMLQNYFIPKLDNLELIEDTVFQQDGAPCHFALRVRQFLNEKFPNFRICPRGESNNHHTFGKATEEECGSKKPAYFAMMFELTWKFNKERICDAIEVFNEKMENSTCFYPEEKLIFEALNESCDSNCNLYEVVKNGKYLAFRLSINAGTESACTCFPDMKNLLKEHECHALHEILQQLLNYCDEPVESQIDVSFNISSSKTN